MVSFNERFLEVYPVTGPCFVYEKGADSVVYSNQPEYRPMLERSELINPGPELNHRARTNTGPIILWNEHRELGRCHADSPSE
jgi:hypothetical protein